MEREAVKALLLDREEPGYGENDPLVDHEFHQPDVSDSGSILGSLRYSKFRIEGFEGEKHAVFIPDHLPLCRETVQDICEFVRDPPSMALCGQGNLRHPRMIATPQLRSCQGFRQLMEEAYSSLGMKKEDQSCWCSSVVAPDPSSSLEDGALSKNQKQALQDFANIVLDKRTTSMVGSVASAAREANTWFFTGPVPTTFDVFLQQCVQSGHAEPFRVVAAHMQDLAWMQCRTSQGLMRQLFDGSRPLHGRVAEEMDCVELSGALWNPKANMANLEFHEHGFGFWSFHSPTATSADKHPVFQFPWPFADLFFLRYRSDSQGSSMQGVQEPDWSFVTSRLLDAEAAGFPPELLGPVGNVFLGGEVKDKVLQCIQAAVPTVVMDNTPDISKQMGVLVSLIQRALDGAPKKELKALMAPEAFNRLPALPVGVSLVQALSPSKVLEHVEAVFSSAGMERRGRLTLGDVVGLLDLAARRPNIFKESVQVLNPLSDSTEEAIASVTSLLCNSLSTVAESPANREIALQGWRLHCRLVRRADQQRRLAGGLVLAVAAAAMLSICSALVLIDGQLEGVRMDEGRLEKSVELNEAPRTMAGQDYLPLWVHFLLGFLASGLPLLAGLVVLLQVRLRPQERWAQSHLAATQVAAEIYRFLGGDRSPEADPTESRQKFLRRLKEITSGALTDSAEEDIGPDVDFGTDPDALRRHINLSLYGVGPRSSRLEGMLHLCGGSPCDGGVQDSSDPAVPVSVESYVHTRMVPLTKCYSRAARSMSAQRAQLGLLIFLLLCGASALGAFGLVVLIPPTLALASFLAAVQTWVAPAANVAAVNRALTALTNLDLHWHGLSVADRSTEDAKHRLISATEQIALAVAMAVTQIPEVDDGQDDEQDGATPRLSAVRPKHGAIGTPRVASTPRGSDRRHHGGGFTPGSWTPRRSARAMSAVGMR